MGDDCIIIIIMGQQLFERYSDLWLFIQITHQNRSLLQNKAPPSPTAGSNINPGLWNCTFKEKICWVTRASDRHVLHSPLLVLGTRRLLLQLQHKEPTQLTPVWRGRVETRHLAGAVWAPPTPKWPPITADPHASSPRTAKSQGLFQRSQGKQC